MHVNESELGASSTNGCESSVKPRPPACKPPINLLPKAKVSLAPRVKIKTLDLESVSKFIIPKEKAAVGQVSCKLLPTPKVQNNIAPKAVLVKQEAKQEEDELDEATIRKATLLPRPKAHIKNENENVQHGEGALPGKILPLVKKECATMSSTSLTMETKAETIPTAPSSPKAKTRPRALGPVPKEKTVQTSILATPKVVPKSPGASPAKSKNSRGSSFFASIFPEPRNAEVDGRQPRGKHPHKDAEALCEAREAITRLHQATKENNDKRNQDSDMGERSSLEAEVRLLDKQTYRTNQEEALLKVWKAIARFRLASVDNMAELHEALETAMQDNLNALGPAAAKVQDEIDHALVQVYKRLEEPMRIREEIEKKKREELAKLREQQTEEENRKRDAQFAEEMKQADETERVNSLFDVIEEWVIAAETVVAEASTAARCLLTDSGVLFVEQGVEILSAEAEATQDAVQAAQPIMAEAIRAVKEKTMELGASDAALKLTTSEEFQVVKDRLWSCRTTLDRLGALADSALKEGVELQRLQPLQRAAFVAVEELEESVSDATEMALVIEESAHTFSSEELSSAAQRAQEAVEKLNPVVRNAWKVILGNFKEMGTSVQALRVKGGPDTQGLNGRVRACEKKLDELKAAARSAMEYAQANVLHERRDNEDRALFETYDVDGDCFLNHMELIAFVKGEYDFDPCRAFLETVICELGEEELGVPLEEIQQLRSMVVVEKGDLLERESDEHRERGQMHSEDDAGHLVRAYFQHSGHANLERCVMEKRTSERLASVHAADKVLREAEETCVGAIRAVGSAGRVANKNARDDVAKSRKALETLAPMLHELVTSCDDVNKQEVVRVLRGLRLAERSAKVRKALDQISKDLSAKQETARLRPGAEIEHFCGLAALNICALMQSCELSGEQLFRQSITGVSDGMGREDFLTLMESLDSLGNDIPFDQSKVNALFDYIVEGSEEICVNSFLTALTRSSFIVVEDTLLTAGMAAPAGDGARALRRLRTGEIVEALDLPSHDDHTGCSRVHCRLANEAIEGWATISSNMGKVKLQPFSNLAV